MKRILLTILLLLCTGVRAKQPVWLVVAPPQFSSLLEPLVQHRKTQGFDTHLQPPPVSRALKNLKSPPDYLLLVGDDEAGKESAFWYLPAKRISLEVRDKNNPSTNIPSDAAWADQNSDRWPEFAVGRIPARTIDEVKTAVQKILAYENAEPSPDDLRMLLWCGRSDDLPFIDEIAPELLLGSLYMKAPDWSPPWIICGNKNHSLCGWPSDQPRLFSEQWKKGALFTFLLGHANPGYFYSMEDRGNSINFYPSNSKQLFSKGDPVAPMVVYACSAGNFTEPDPCMAETLLFYPGGPVATIAATTTAYALPNVYLPLSHFQCLSDGPMRIGDLLLRIQKESLNQRITPLEWIYLRGAGGLPEGKTVPDMMEDQILITSLLGDPAMQVPLPEPLDVTINKTRASWNWKVTPPAGALHLYVGQRVTEVPFPPHNGSSSQKEANKNLFGANAAFEFKTITTFDTTQSWQGTIKPPCTVRFLATGKGRCWVKVEGFD